MVSTVPLYRFGPYEFDLERNELRKSGLRIKLEPKPLQILVTLLERSGEVVTRTELQDTLWAEGIFVDFEKGLTVAVTKLRAALNDSSEKPKYIATVAREGYRFVAEVERVFVVNAASTGTNGSHLSVPHSNDIQDLAERSTLIPVNGRAAASVRVAPPATDRGLSKLRRPWTLVMSATVIAIATAVAWFQVADRVPVPTVSNYIQISNDARTKISPRGYVPMATDGARIYYSEISNIFRLIEVSSGGGESVEVPSALPSNFLLGISPDHTQLLVQDQTAAPSQMPFWALPLVGGTVHKLGNVLGQEAAWSPDGRWLAFSRSNELFLATAQGTEPRKLATLQGSPEWIRWSPDASKLRFTIQDNKSDSRSLWEVLADGSNLHPFLPNWTQLSDRVPGDTSLGGECCGTWTPDGGYFFFQSARGGRNDIWMIRENRGWFHSSQSEPVRLTSGAPNYTSPLPSLDGRQLFVAGSSARGELTRYDVHSQQFVSYLSGISAEGVDFSRDGQWITYVAYPEGTLWRSKLDGSQRLQLTRPPMRAFLPRWAPDGRRVAFAGKLPGKTYDIYLVSADDGTPEQLTNGEHDFADVSWSADGTRLIFGEMFSTTDPAIHLLDLQSKKI